MTGKRQRRVVAAGAAAAVLTAVIGAGMAWGNVGDGGTITACYKKSDGRLRVIDPASDKCGRHEVQLTWSTGTALADGAVVGGQGGVVADETIDGYDIKDGSVGTSDLAPDAVTSAKILNGTVTGGTGGDIAANTILGGATGNLALNTIDASNLADGAVSGGYAGVITDLSLTADDLADNAVTFSKITAGAVQGEGGAGSGTPATGNIALKSITNANIAEHTIRGGRDNNPGAVANEIMDGTVTADDLADGSVIARLLAPGAVDPSRQTANAASGSSSGSVTDATSPANVGSTAITLTDPSNVNHQVLVTGQLNLACSATCPTTPGTVSYQLFATDGLPTAGVAIGSEMTTSIGQSQNLVLPLSALDSRGSSSGGHAWTYFVRLSSSSTAPGTVTVLNVPITAIDLGRG